MKESALTRINLKAQTTRISLYITLAIGATLLMAPPTPQAQTVTTIHNFVGADNALSPFGPIAQGRDGNFYGIALAPSSGVVYKMTPGGTLTVVHQLLNDQSEGINCNGLIAGNDGNFYGTCEHGGNNSNSTGTFFKVTPTGTFTVLHDFDGTFSDTVDGCYPLGVPVQASDGNFYGTTFECGAHDTSLIYKITPAGVFSAIYAFASGSGDGYQPQGALIQGSDGNLWGTTSSGGANNAGAIFKSSLAGAESVVYSFAACGTGTTGCDPLAGLVQGTDGNFYGTAEQGGANNTGVVFKVTPAGTYSLLHSFNVTTDNGAFPQLPLTLGTDGNFYGVATDCFAGGCNPADIFKITSKGMFTDLFNFPDAGGNSNSAPLSPLLLSTDGTFYSTTELGGSNSSGSFYSLVDGQSAFIVLQETSGKVGSQIGILGQGFGATSVVKFNGATATKVTLAVTTFLTATVPTGATDGFVTVTTGTTKLTSRVKFTVHNSWASGAAMPTAREGAAVGVIGGKVYVVSGATASAIVGNNEIYNPTTNTWTTGAAIPTPVFIPASAVVKNILYVMGGIKDSSQTPQGIVQAYNPATNTWSTKASMPTPNDSANAVVLNNLIYVIGGFTGSRSPIVQVYNPATDSWSTASNLLVAKSGSALGLLGTTIVSTGGLENNNSPTGDTEGYNASTNTWTALTTDATPRNGGCGTAIAGQVYVTGGSTAGVAGSATATTESYNLTKNAWTTQATAPLAVVNAVPAVANGQMYCFGGSSDGRLFTGTVSNNVQIYQP